MGLHVYRCQWSLVTTVSLFITVLHILKYTCAIYNYRKYRREEIQSQQRLVNNMMKNPRYAKAEQEYERRVAHEKRETVRTMTFLISFYLHWVVLVHDYFDNLFCPSEL